MFELLLVMLTITSPVLFIVLIRCYFSYRSNIIDEPMMLLQDVQSKQKSMEVSIDNLLERLDKLEYEKLSA